MLNATFQKKMPSVIELFKKHKVKSAYAFGSVVTDKFGEDSDVDLLINFQDDLEPLERGELWWELHDNLRELLNREIDLLTESSLKNPYFIEELNEKKVKIYG